MPPFLYLIPMNTTPNPSIFAIFSVFLRLGLTSFGGPIAHLGYFREEFVTRRGWMDDRAYGDLVALCQFLPGPASSQVGFAIGLLKGRFLGGLAAWVGFTLPSAALLFLAATGIHLVDGPIASAAIDGLKIVAVAVVAHALWGMSRSLAPDAPRAAIAFLAMAGVLLAPMPTTQLIVIALAGLVGMVVSRPDAATNETTVFQTHGSAPAVIALVFFFALLFGLPALAAADGQSWLALADGFYRSGALVFGGGHVVLPLLDAQVADPNNISDDLFLAGYGAAQAVPGPLFTLAAYLGALSPSVPSPVVGAAIGIVAIFLPGMLLVYAALPFWSRVTQSPNARAVLNGVNAGVVGILAAALYTPIWTSAVRSPTDFIIASGAFLLLTVARLSAGWVVLITVAAAVAFQLVS